MWRCLSKICGREFASTRYVFHFSDHRTTAITPSRKNSTLGNGKPLNEQLALQKASLLSWRQTARVSANRLDSVRLPAPVPCAHAPAPDARVCEEINIEFDNQFKTARQPLKVLHHAPGDPPYKKGADQSCVYGNICCCRHNAKYNNSDRNRYDNILCVPSPFDDRIYHLHGPQRTISEMSPVILRRCCISFQILVAKMPASVDIAEGFAAAR
jgi:hypothetical protein